MKRQAFCERLGHPPVLEVYVEYPDASLNASYCVCDVPLPSKLRPIMELAVRQWEHPSSAVVLVGRPKDGHELELKQALGFDLD